MVEIDFAQILKLLAQICAKKCIIIPQSSNRKKYNLNYWAKKIFTVTCN